MNMDSSLRIHLENLASLRKRALKLLTILDNVPMAKMTRAQFKELELLERKAAVPVSYHNYEDNLTINKEEVEKLEIMVACVSSPA